MSSYQLTTFAIAKIKRQDLTYNQTHKLLNLGSSNYLEDIEYYDEMDDLDEFIEDVKEAEPTNKEIALLPNPHSLDIVEDPYENKKDENGKYMRGTLYLFKELCYIPKSTTELDNLISQFKKYDEFVDMDTFDIKSLVWYNGADMPLFE